MPRVLRSLLLLAVCWAVSSGVARAQQNPLSLSLNSQATPGFVTLNLVLDASPGFSPAALQWSLNYRSPDVVGFVASPGPVATDAGKMITCAVNQCVLFGLDGQAIQNGVVAVITFQLAGSPSRELEFAMNAGLGASPEANALPGGQNSLSVLLRPFALEPSVAAGLSLTGSAAQLVSFGGWNTTLNLVNLGARAANLRLRPFRNTGDSLVLPWMQSDLPSTAFLAPSVDEALAPGASFSISTSLYDSQPIRIDSAQLFTSGGVDGLYRFQYQPTGQEAAAPIEKRNAGSYFVPFDQTAGKTTGIAIQNLAPEPALIPVLFRDEDGHPTGSTSLWLPPNGNAAFAAGGQFAATVNQRGTLQFSTPPAGRIGVLGSQSTSDGGFTVLQPLTTAEARDGAAPFFAAGGGWTTAIQLTNLGSTAATPHLHFLASNGSDLSLPLSYGGISTNRSTLDPVIPPGGSLEIECTDIEGAAFQSGSIQMTSNGLVGASLVFRYDPTGQQAAAPFETRGAASYAVPFDNSGDLATSVALANTTGSSTRVDVLIRDSAGAQIGSETVSLLPNGNDVFLLGARFPETLHQVGTVQFTTPTAGEISVFALRFPASGNFSNIPVLKP